MPALETFIRKSGYWLGLPILVTLLGQLPDNLLNQTSLLMLYLMSVLFCSLRTGLNEVIASALASLFLFNFFHTQPLYSFYMRDLDEIIAGCLFMAFAMLAGNVSLALKKQLHDLEQRGRFLKTQVELGRQLQHVNQEEDILPLLNRVARDTLGDAVSFRLLPPNSSDNPGNSWYLTWTVKGEHKPMGDDRAIILNIKEQTQSVLDRMAVNRELKSAEQKSDEDRLRSALLSSVSHDLKTPLLSVLDAAGRLQERTEPDNSEKHELLNTILTESRRLESYIQNLLDMTRIGHGELSLSRERITLDELVRVVEERISTHWPDASIRLEADDSSASLYIHGALVEQALFNAVENAVKAEGGQGEILITARHSRRQLELRVCDHGPGMPEGEWEAAFDQFYTFSDGDSYEKGTGLGLSICRSIFRVHGGEARIVPPPQGFSHCLLLTLPISEEDEDRE